MADNLQFICLGGEVAVKVGCVQIEACPTGPGLLQLQMGQRHQTTVFYSLAPLPVPGQLLAAYSSLPCIHNAMFQILPTAMRPTPA